MLWVDCICKNIIMFVFCVIVMGGFEFEFDSDDMGDEFEGEEKFEILEYFY